MLRPAPLAQRARGEQERRPGKAQRKERGGKKKEKEKKERKRKRKKEKKMVVGDVE